MPADPWSANAQSGWKPNPFLERGFRGFLLGVRGDQRRVHIDDQRVPRARCMVGGVLAGQRPCPGASSLARRVDRCDRPDGVGGERGDQAGHGRIRRDKPEHARLAPQRVDIGERVTTQSERDREIRDNFARIMCRERFPPRRQRVRQRQVEACRAHRFREQDTARLPDRGDSRGVDVNSWVRSGILHLEGAPFLWTMKLLDKLNYPRSGAPFLRHHTPQRREP